MRALAFALLAAAVLAGLWIGLRPPPPAAPQGSTAGAVTPAPETAPRRFGLTIPSPSGADGVLRVQQGEAVELTVTSAEDDELHLHGYDLALKLRAGEAATLVFTAVHAGRFEIELHHRHAEIGALEVSPR